MSNESAQTTLPVLYAITKEGKTSEFKDLSSTTTVENLKEIIAFRIEEEAINIKLVMAGKELKDDTFLSGYLNSDKKNSMGNIHVIISAPKATANKKQNSVPSEGENKASPSSSQPTADDGNTVAQDKGEHKNTDTANKKQDGSRIPPSYSEAFSDNDKSSDFSSFFLPFPNKSSSPSPVGQEIEFMLHIPQKGQENKYTKEIDVQSSEASIGNIIQEPGILKQLGVDFDKIVIKVNGKSVPNNTRLKDLEQIKGRKLKYPLVMEIKKEPSPPSSLPTSDNNMNKSTNQVISVNSQSTKHFINPDLQATAKNIMPPAGENKVSSFSSQLPTDDPTHKQINNTSFLSRITSLSSSLSFPFSKKKDMQNTSPEGKYEGKHQLHHILFKNGSAAKNLVTEFKKTEHTKNFEITDNQLINAVAGKKDSEYAGYWVVKLSDKQLQCAQENYKNLLPEDAQKVEVEEKNTNSVNKKSG